MKLEEVTRDRPFHVNKRFPSGNLKDHSILLLDKDNRIRIWFRDLKAWVNPPTDTNQTARIIRDIQKYGVAYTTEVSRNGVEYKTSLGKNILSRLEPSS